MDVHSAEKKQACAVAHKIKGKFIDQGFLNIKKFIQLTDDAIMAISQILGHNCTNRENFEACA